MDIDTIRTEIARAERDHDASPTAAKWQHVEELQSRLRQAERLAANAAAAKAAEERAAKVERLAEINRTANMAATLAKVAPIAERFAALAAEAAPLVAEVDAILREQWIAHNEAEALVRELGEGSAPALVARGHAIGPIARAVTRRLLADGHQDRSGMLVQLAPFFETHVAEVTSKLYGN